MVDVTTSIDLRCPLHRVSQFASDPDNAPLWYDNIKAVEWLSQKPLSLGSKIAFVAQFLGRQLSYTYEITQLDATSLVMSTAEGPFPMETSYTWSEPEHGVTKMTLRNCGAPSGFSLLLAPLMSMMMRRANMKDLRKLKRILEA